jgi:ABC-2 type transport system permease protein
MKDLMTVIGFTFGNKVRTKSFKVTTAILVILAILAAHIPFFAQLFSGDDEPAVIGVFQDEQGIAVMLQRQADAQDPKPFDVLLVEDPGSDDARLEQMRAGVEEGNVKGYVLFVEQPESAFPMAVYYSDGNLGQGLRSSLTQALGQVKNEMLLRELNLTQEQSLQLFMPISLETERLDEEGAAREAEKDPMEELVDYILVYIMIVALFMGIMITGQFIASEITTEKSSRIMEIIVTSVAPLTQMFGKIIGMMMVGLLQIILLGAAIFFSFVLPHNREAVAAIDIDLGSVDPLLIIYFVVFYFLGYFLYATLFAAVGSIVSRMEDLGQAVMPMTFLVLGAFYIGIFGINTPEAPFVVAMSYVPFFSPMAMFMRIGVSDPAWWEVALSLGILALSILLFGWLSAKIYRVGVLMYGKRPNLKELRKAMKAYKV